MPERAVIYARQSTERDHSTSIEDQVAMCRRYCADQGWDVADVVIDRDTSGSARPWRDRGEFPRVFDIDCDVLVLYRWDRLSRERFDQEEILKKWGALDRTMQAVTEPIDASTASGELNRGMLMMFAAYQAKVIGERWRETLRKREVAGLPKNGLPRFGYVKNGKSYEVDPVTGPLLADLYRRYIKGAGVQSLRLYLNENDIMTTSGNPWSVTTLTRVLDSGWGAGKIVTDAGTTYVQGAHEPVITDDEWQRYLDVRHSRRQQPPRRKVATWHLTGIAVCGLCGGSLHRKGKGGREAICGTYGKKEKGKKPPCPGTFILRATIERAVTNWIGAGGIDLFPETAQDDDGAQHFADELEVRLAAIQGRLARLAEGWADGVLDAEGYRGARDSALQEREQVEAALRTARDEAALARPVTQDEWSRLEVGDVTTGEWNGLLRRTLRRVELHPDRLVIVPVVGDKKVIPR